MMKKDLGLEQKLDMDKKQGDTMTQDENIKKNMDSLVATAGASSVKLEEDGFLKIIIDLNVIGEEFIETRVAAFGTLEWAKELSSRWIMAKEMMYTKQMALKAQKTGLIPPGVIDISKMGPPK